MNKLLVLLTIVSMMLAMPARGIESPEPQSPKTAATQPTPIVYVQEISLYPETGKYEILFRFEPAVVPSGIVCELTPDQARAYINRFPTLKGARFEFDTKNLDPACHMAEYTPTKLH